MRTLFVAAALASALVGSVAAASSAAKPRTLATRGPVIALAADGDRAALVVGGRRGCASIVVWEATRRRVVRFRSAARCESGEVSVRESTDAVVLAGTRVAWIESGGGLSHQWQVNSATLARPTPRELASGVLSDGGDGTLASGLVGDGKLLAFTVERRCTEYDGSEYLCPPGRKTGEVFAANVWRVAGHGPCPSSSGSRGCQVIAEVEGEQTVLAGDAGRIVVRTEDGLMLRTGKGDFLRDFDVVARAAAISGKRLAVRTAGAVEVYDTDSGSLLRRFAAAKGVRLEDLDNGVLVTASGGKVTLRRLGDGRTATLSPGGIARGQLERPGLFVSGKRGVTFTPMRDVLRRLAG